MSKFALSEDYIRNPLTGRMIKRGGRIWKNLVVRGVLKPDRNIKSIGREKGKSEAQIIDEKQERESIINGDKEVDEVKDPMKKMRAKIVEEYSDECDEEIVYEDECNDPRVDECNDPRVDEKVEDKVDMKDSEAFVESHNEEIDSDTEMTESLPPSPPKLVRQKTRFPNKKGRPTKMQQEEEIMLYLDEQLSKIL